MELFQHAIHTYIKRHAAYGGAGVFWHSCQMPYDFLPERALDAARRRGNE